MMINLTTKEKELVFKFLAKWPYSPDIKAITLNRNELYDLCVSLNNEPFKYIRFLKNCSVIDVDLDGNYVLSDEGQLLKRKLHSIAPSLHSEVPSTGDWKDFFNLMSYYLNCVKYEDKIQQYLRPGKDGIDYFLPNSFPANWLEPLNSSVEKHATHILKLTKKQTNILVMLLGNDNPFYEVYLGYPLQARFNSDGTVDSYVPVAMVPVIVHYSGNASEIIGKREIEIELDFNRATLNQRWFDYTVPDDEKETVRDILFDLHKGTDLEGSLDMKRALDILLPYDETYRNGFFDYKCLDQSLPLVNSSKKKTHLCNSAVIFKATSTPFHKTLINNLNQIKKMPAKKLDYSSLAYIFRNPLKSPSTLGNSVPLQFISSNYEQLEAVENGLRFGASKIQGPPGTGKSQVAVNFIANCILRGKSVLFTSKNTAALNAIYERANSIFSAYELPLVRFCVDESNVRTAWYDLDYRHEVDNLKAIDTSAHERQEALFNVAIQNISDICELEKKNERIKQQIASKQEDFLKLQRMQENEELSIGVPNNVVIEDLIASLVYLERSRGKFKGLFFSKDKKKKAYDSLSSLSTTMKIKIDNGEYQQIENVLHKITALKKSKEKIAKEISSLKICIESKDYSLDYNQQLGIANTDIDKVLLRKWQRRINSLEEQDFRAIEDLADEFSRDHLFEQTHHLSNADIANLRSVFSNIFKIIPAWSTSLLSLYRAAPLIEGLFDYVVIDEAAQCDPISVIPAMFVSKRVLVIGDNQQFRPIVKLDKKKDSVFWRQAFGYDKNLIRYSFTRCTAYDIVDSHQTMLKEHFRCAEDIAQYFNELFYNNLLRIRTEEKKKPLIPSCLDKSSSFQWRNVTGGVDAEVDTALELFEQIRGSDYDGSIGIITPLKFVSDMINQKLYDKGYSEEDCTCGTAYSFQGGERDVILFVLGYSNELKKGQTWYLTSEENKNIYNVTISRAKSCLVVIGNKELCKQSSMRALRALASYPKANKNGIYFASFSEELLYKALVKNGIYTKPQYPVDGYRLDLAYLEDSLKLDIEVDGQNYHTNSDGSRLNHDFIRDYVLEKDGWIVLRFWTSDVYTELDRCVKEVISTILRLRVSNADLRNQRI